MWIPVDLVLELVHRISSESVDFLQEQSRLRWLVLWLFVRWWKQQSSDWADLRSLVKTGISSHHSIRWETVDTPWRFEITIKPTEFHRLRREHLVVRRHSRWGLLVLSNHIFGVFLRKLRIYFLFFALKNNYSQKKTNVFPSPPLKVLNIPLPFFPLLPHPFASPAF